MHNCDSSSQALSYLLYSTGTTAAPVDPKEQKLIDALEDEKEKFLTDAVYDVYGMDDIY